MLINYEFKNNRPFLEVLFGTSGNNQEGAKEAFKKFQTNPYYPSLHFKQVHSTRPIFSVRITKDYRAIGIIQEGDIVWFWIGSHSEYISLLRQLKYT